MSSTRKPKPPDRGAPDHKPSRKVALNEVLRSLQDLVQNELNVEPAAGQSIATAKAAAPSPQPAPEPPAPEASAPETAPPGATLADHAPPSVRDEASATAQRPAPKTKPDKTRRPSPAGGVQQELPYLDPDAERESVAIDAGTLDTASAAPAVAAPETSSVQDPEVAAFEPVTEPAVDPATPETEPVHDTLEFEAETLPMLPDSNVAASGDAPAHDTLEIETETLPTLPDNIVEASGDAPVATGDGQDRAEWLADESDALNDIPVLEDAVDLIETMPDEAASALASPVHRPAPAEARRLAIQAAARLNVALRKEGKPVLASDVIARLVRELEQVLANGAPNVDNTRPKQN